MSIATRFGARAYLVLAFITLMPFFLGVVAVWSPPANFTIAAIDQAICTYAVLVLAFMSGVRWGVTVIRPGGSSAALILLALVPPVTVWGAAFLAPSISNRWALALVIAAFAVQGAWDLNTSDLPDMMKRARPIVTIGALAALLAALLAS